MRLVTMLRQELNLGTQIVPRDGSLRRLRGQERRQSGLLCLQPGKGLFECRHPQQCRLMLTRESGRSRLCRHELQPGAIEIDRLASREVPGLP